MITNGLAIQVANRAALAALLEYLDANQVEPYTMASLALRGDRLTYLV